MSDFQYPENPQQTDDSNESQVDRENEREIEGKDREQVDQGQGRQRVLQPAHDRPLVFLLVHAVDQSKNIFDRKDRDGKQLKPVKPGLVGVVKGFDRPVNDREHIQKNQNKYRNVQITDDSFALLGGRGNLFHQGLSFRFLFPSSRSNPSISRLGE